MSGTLPALCARIAQHKRVRFPTRPFCIRLTVVEVQLPGADGYLGVLPGAAPLITELGIGELTYHARSGGAASEPMAIIRGFAEVLPDRVTVLADVAERAEEISEGAAEEARRRAQERLAGQLSAEEEAQMIQILETAEARLRLARIRRGRPG